MSCVVCGVVVVPFPWFPGQVMVQGLSSQGSVGRCVERIRVIGHVVLLGWVPCVPWCGLLIRTWACYSEPGQYRPRTEQAVHVWDSRLMCGTGRPRAGGGSPTPGSPHRARTRYAEPGPSCPHVDPLVGVVNRYAARRTASRSVNNTSLSPPGNADQPRGGLRTGCACRLCVARPGPMRDSRRVRRA